MQIFEDVERVSSPTRSTNQMVPWMIHPSFKALSISSADAMLLEACKRFIPDHGIHPAGDEPGDS